MYQQLKNAIKIISDNAGALIYSTTDADKNSLTIGKLCDFRYDNTLIICFFRIIVIFA